jgi:hypothetical protein
MPESASSLPQPRTIYASFPSILQDWSDQFGLTIMLVHRWDHGDEHNITAIAHDVDGNAEIQTVRWNGDDDPRTEAYLASLGLPGVN